MKLILIYPNGTRYSYKGFTISEMTAIINESYEWDYFKCIGWEWGHNF